MTPMIDMTFLLLIFFMLTSRFTREEVKVDIALARAEHALAQENLSDRDIINIDADGVYHLGDRPAEPEQVAFHLRERFRDHPPLRVYIRADRTTPAARLKRLMRMCSEAGAIDIIIGTVRH